MDGGVNTRLIGQQNLVRHYWMGLIINFHYYKRNSENKKPAQIFDQDKYHTKSK